MSFLPDHAARHERARLSLEGLSLGDSFGERFFINPAVVEGLIEQRALPAGPWTYTDDTEMALAVVETLGFCGAIDRDWLAERFAERYRANPMRGYGGGAHTVLQEIGAGIGWRKAARELFAGQGSFGNGGAMRSAPIGAYFAGDTARIVAEARASAEVTHAHPDGQAGAVAVALGAAHAWEHRHEPAAVAGPALLEYALLHTPEGATQEGLARALDLLPTASLRLAAEALGTGVMVSSSDTVPFSLFCAARHLDSFEEALWATVSGLGDRDTTCAMVGGIVALRNSALPGAWLREREALSLS
jgi:ADP-ribosylglycohydrolase